MGGISSRINITLQTFDDSVSGIAKAKWGLIWVNLKCFFFLQDANKMTEQVDSTIAQVGSKTVLSQIQNCFTRSTDSRQLGLLLAVLHTPRRPGAPLGADRHQFGVESARHLPPHAWRFIPFVFVLFPCHESLFLQRCLNAPATVGSGRIQAAAFPPINGGILLVSGKASSPRIHTTKARFSLN